MLTIKPLAYAAAVAIVASTIFLALSLGAANLDRTRLVDRLRAAQTSGALDATARLFPLRPDYPVRLWENNECLILYMLASPNYRTHWQQAVSPLTPVNPVAGACFYLKDILAGHPGEESYYHRYLHGYRVATAFMLVLMPLYLIPWVLLTLAQLLVLTLVAVAVVKLRRAGSPAQAQESRGYVALGLSLLLFWGLLRFAPSISFAFGDMVVIAVALTFLLRNPLRMREGTFLLVCCGFGALVAWFEFLTGQIPLLLAMIPGCLAISSCTVPDRRLLWRRITQGLIAFAATVVACVLIKWAVVAATFGGSVMDNFGAPLDNIVAGPTHPLHNETTRRLLESLGLPVVLGHTFASRLLWTVMSIGLSTPTIGFGSFFAGAGVLVASAFGIVGGSIALWRTASTPIERTRLAAFLVSLAMLGLWIAVFNSQFINHTSYMIRPLVWLPALAMITCTWAWFSSSRKNS
jgi:hypothetical protein